jgi:hypothetical protein
MQLFPQEQIIENVLNTPSFVLTTHRIRYTWRGMFSNNEYVNSIMLEKISSIEERYKNYPLILVLAILLLIAGSYAGSIEAGLVGGLIFLALWFFTRKHVLSIYPDGGAAINVDIKNRNQQTIVSFIDQIEMAKLKRTESLND